MQSRGAHHLYPLEPPDATCPGGRDGDGMDRQPQDYQRG
jgi:hypothetical protein